MAATPLGIAIIGAGQILKRHAEAYRARPHLARLVGIADLDEGRAQAAQRAYGFQRATRDYRELLDCRDVDAVSVCTPAGTHAAIALDVLGAGKHVLVEKPLATCLEDTDRLIEAAERAASRTSCCVFQLRLDPAYRRLRWIIENGEIGRILTASVRVKYRKSPLYFSSVPGRGSLRTDGGGVAINQAIHQLDALLYLLGEPVEASAVMGTLVHPIEGEDALTGWIRFNNGVLAGVDCSTFAKRREFFLEVVGENAAVRLYGDPDRQEFDFAIDAPGSAAPKAVRERAARAIPTPRPRPKWLRRLDKLRRSGASSAPPIGHAAVIEEFLTAARDGRPGPMTFREARRSLEMVSGLYLSARTGRGVRFPLIDEREPVARQAQAASVLTASGERLEPHAHPERERDAAALSAE